MRITSPDRGVAKSCTKWLVTTARRPSQDRFDAEQIGGRLRWARKERLKLSMAKLAPRIGMTEDQLRKKEKGINPFYLNEISQICELLKAPSLFPFMDWGEAKLADKLLGRDEPPSGS